MTKLQSNITPGQEEKEEEKNNNSYKEQAIIEWGWLGYEELCRSRREN